LRNYWDFIQKRICKKANGTAYVTKEYIQKRYPPNVGEDYFTTSYTDTNIDDGWLAMKSSKGPTTECVLIHVATSIAGNAKGHRELLVALGELVKKGYPVKTVLVGNGELNEECRTIVERYNIQDRIRKTGVLAKSELMKELSEADIFVFPSYVEGLPRVVVEAIGMGLPCVATDLPGNRELIDEEFLVPVFDTKLLEQKIETLLDDEIRTAVGKRNRLVAEEYHVDKIKQKRKEFYLQLKEMVRK
jgi:glycosyltransferase involved in cell wall biosynthesis